MIRYRYQFCVVMAGMLFFCTAFSFTNPCIELQTGVVQYAIIAKPNFMTYHQKGELIFNGQVSVFVRNKGEKKLITQKDEVTGKMGGWLQDEIGNVIYKNFVDKRMIIREYVWQQPYLTEEPVFFKFDWKIEKEKKTIGNYKCKKALTIFRGRKYIAWFTTEIPISDGPWKFSGLPGLIMEVADESGDYQFLFESITYPVQGREKEIQQPTDGSVVDFKTYQQADDIEFEKMRRKSLSNSNDRNSSTKITKTPQNPIELKYE